MSAAKNHRQAAPARNGGWHAGTNILLTLAALGVLGIAWGLYSQWSEDSRPIAERPAETKVSLEGVAAPSGGSPTHPVERARMRSAPPALMHANAEAPERRAVADESFAPSDEPATELAVLQALDEPDDEARFQRLQEAIGSGAEVPVDKFQEVLVTDPAEKVRELALQALAEHPEATGEQIRALAEGALGNQSLVVRARAQRILDEMSELERIDRESRQIQSAM